MGPHLVLVQPIYVITFEPSVVHVFIFFSHIRPCLNFPSGPFHFHFPNKIYSYVFTINAPYSLFLSIKI